MPEYLLLMHNDTVTAEDVTRWSAYLEALAVSGALRGGSAIGDGTTVRREGTPAPVTSTLAGFIRVDAADLDAARALLEGNPVFEAGGTIELRELPPD